MKPTLKLAIGSLVVGFVVLALKALAYWVTGSVALLSDALESTVNVATAFAVLVAIKIASRPADTNHPYGHHKAEYFSAVLEGVMIIIAALLILREAYQGFMDPTLLMAPTQGLIINLGATALNGAWAWVLINRGQVLKSPALVADGRHLVTDVLTSFGLAAGIVLVILTGWAILDPILAALVALHILGSGSKIIKESLSGLMDEALPEAQLTDIRAVITDNAAGAIEAHDLRTRQAGAATFIDFHLVVASDTTVFHAHEICDRIETALEEMIPNAVITIHVEPAHKSEDSGAILLD